MVDGQVMIIDEFTGRILEGRRWSEGLHQAVEAKEGVAIGEENQTLATITLQNYFRLYDKLSGMTGTALTEATEFMKIYKVPVVEIPTNQPMVRDDQQRPDLQDQRGQVEGGARRDRRPPRKRPADPGRHGLGRGLGDDLRRAEAQGIEHAVLNAKPEHAEREGERIAQAGRKGARDDRHQHGRPRRRHQARRRPRALAMHELKKKGLDAGDEGYEEALEEKVAEMEPQMRGRGRGSARARRALHLRHRAPRVAPHRQPAARPLPAARATPARPASSSPPRTT